jgi:hypothetical protein
MQKKIKITGIVNVMIISGSYIFTTYFGSLISGLMNNKVEYDNGDYFILSVGFMFTIYFFPKLTNLLKEKMYLWKLTLFSILMAIPYVSGYNLIARFLWRFERMFRLMLILIFSLIITLAISIIIRVFIKERKQKNK